MLNRRTLLKAGGAALAPLFLCRGASGSDRAQFERVKRVTAFIIGADYPCFSKGPGDLGLNNGVADAETIATTLGGLRNVERPLFFPDPSGSDWRAQLAVYRERARKGDFAIFYYAGHAFQSGTHLSFLCNDGRSAVSAEQVLHVLLEGIQGVFFIVDACRASVKTILQQQNVDHVPVHDVRTRGILRDPMTTPFDLDPDALRAVEPSSMTLPSAHGIEIPVAGRVRFLYSTDGRQIASDGPPGKGGPFARIAAQELVQRVDIEAVVQRISRKVRELTQDTRTPQRPTSAGHLDFPMYIAGGPRNVSVAEPRGNARV